MFEPMFVRDFNCYLKRYSFSHLEEEGYYEFPNNYALCVKCKYMYNFDVKILYYEDDICYTAWWINREDFLQGSGSSEDKPGEFYSLNSWEVLYILTKIEQFPDSRLFLKKIE